METRLISKQLTLNRLFAEKAAFLKTLPSEELEALHRYAKISTIGASTRIENAVLTDAEINWMDTLLGQDAKRTALEANRAFIEDKLSKDRERSIEEVAGCRAMLHLIYEQARDFWPLTEAALRGLHHELLRHLPTAARYAGRYKVQPNSVVETNHRTKEVRVVFQTADPGPMTITAMADLLAWYNRALTEEPWSLAVACELVFRFLAIHPFQDGNGRMGRGLFLLSLLQGPMQGAAPDFAFVSRYLAIDRQIERHKEEYYVVLNRCSGGRFCADPTLYHIEYFLHFMIKVLENALDDIDVYRKRFAAQQTLSASAERILNCFREKPETKLHSREIIEITGVPRRTVVHALTSLVQDGLLQRLGRGAGVRYRLVF